MLRELALLLETNADPKLTRRIEQVFSPLWHIIDDHEHAQGNGIVDMPPTTEVYHSPEGGDDGDQ